MLFRKKIERRCSYCLHSAKLSEDLLLCSKRGVVPVFGQCSRFKYDPCKRIPARAKTLDFCKYDQEDYSL